MLGRDKADSVTELVTIDLSDLLILAALSAACCLSLSTGAHLSKALLHESAKPERLCFNSSDACAEGAWAVGSLQ